MIQLLEKLSLPEPDFSGCSKEELTHAVLKEMHQTNFLENYGDRIERCSLIITKWMERNTEIYNEGM